jgi:hypothetical protein
VLASASSADDVQTGSLVHCPAYAPESHGIPLVPAGNSEHPAKLVDRESSVSFVAHATYGLRVDWSVVVGN